MTDTPSTTDAEAAGGRITLTRVERELFDLLLGANEWAGLGQTLRVAGGWVRDKLLGGESDDIDISLDSMTGDAFVKELRRYAAAHADAGRGVRGEPLPKGGLGRGYLVAENIERSKHLETAGIAIGGLKVEFVHLRSETYAEGSRVPEVRFGDAVTDAERRDLTINALFYRLDTGAVEDLVGGLEDLRSMTLRTPLEPERTFIDDPLRVLRVLRFRARFGRSTIEEAALRAMASPRVRESYRTKVAPERAAAEVLKLFAGAAPGPALRAMGEAGIAGDVFGEPSLGIAASVEAADVAASAHAELAATGLSEKQRGLGVLAAFLRHALLGSGCAEDDLPGRIERALKRIGIGKDDRGAVARAAAGAELVRAEAFEDRDIGRLLLYTDPACSDDGPGAAWVWRLAFAAAGAEAGGQQADATEEGRPQGCSAAEVGRRGDLVEAYLAAPPPLAPLVDGRELMQLFPNVPPRTGFIRIAQERLLDEQLARRISTREQALRFVSAIPENELHGG